MSSESKYLQKISDQLVDESIVNSDSFSQKKIGRFQKVADGRFMYLHHEAGSALHYLLESFWEKSLWKDKVTFAEYHNAGSGEIINFLSENNDRSLDILQARINSCVSKICISATFYEGCFIIPYPAASFSIGPVRFSNTSDFENSIRNRNIEFGIDDFMGHLNEHGVVWVAEIDLEDVSQNRGDAISKMSIDLALASIQLLFKGNHEGMRRLSSLNPLHKIVTFSVCTDGRVSGNLRNYVPGLTYSGPWFTQFLREKDPLFKSFGNRIFCISKEKNKLDMSWCDSLYWFHEGIAESIDTVAVTKLETSLEILLCSENASGSKRKILQALKFFFGKSENDPINQETDLTLGDLAKNLVRTSPLMVMALMSI